VVKILFAISLVLDWQDLVYLAHGAMFYRVAGFALFGAISVDGSIFFRPDQMSTCDYRSLIGGGFIPAAFTDRYINSMPLCTARLGVSEGSQTSVGMAGLYILKTLFIVFCRPLIAAQVLRCGDPVYLVACGGVSNFLSRVRTAPILPQSATH